MVPGSPYRSPLRRQTSAASFSAGNYQPAPSPRGAYPRSSPRPLAVQRSLSSSLRTASAAPPSSPSAHRPPPSAATAYAALRSTSGAVRLGAILRNAPKLLRAAALRRHVTLLRHLSPLTPSTVFGVPLASLGDDGEAELEPGQHNEQLGHELWGRRRHQEGGQRGPGLRVVGGSQLLPTVFGYARA